MAAGLPVSRLVNVGVNLTPALASIAPLSTCLLLGTSKVIDVVTRMREYSNIAQVAADFGTNAEEYAAAVLWFEQQPSPTSFFIGRWAKTASNGQLFCGPLSAANSLIGAWTAIANGTLKINVDGGALTNVTALNFGAVGNLNAVAAVIQTGVQALGGAFAAATCTYDSVFNRFIFTSGTTGAASSVAFLAAEGSGTDITGMLAGLVTSGGAYVANGIVAETALAAVELFDNMFSSQWYGLVIPDAVPADHEAVAQYIEADSPSHFYGVTTQDPLVLSSVDTTDIAYLLASLKLTHSFVQYSSTSNYAVLSALARILTTQWGGNNTTITLMYQQEPGVVPETLNQTQITALEAKNCNVIVAYNNGTAILETGVTPSGIFADEIIGVDWLRSAIQTNVYNLLYGSTTKVPQTDAGNQLIATAIAAACSQGVANGLIAPGTWNTAGFGQLVQGGFLSQGFYVYAPPIANQSQAARTARQSVPFQVAVKMAGAIQFVAITVNVNA